MLTAGARDAVARRFAGAIDITDEAKRRERAEDEPLRGLT